MLLTILTAILFPTLPSQFIKALFFTHMDYEQQAPIFGYSVIYVAWTLSYEVMFYFIFAIAMFINHKYRSLLCIALMLTVIPFLQWITTGSFSFDVEKNVGYTGNLAMIVNVLSNPINLEFIVGILIYEATKIYKDKIKLISFNIKPILISLITIPTIAVVGGSTASHGLTGYGIYAAIALTSIVLYGFRFNMPNSPPLRWIGDISYSLYLVHPIVMLAFRHYDINFLSMPYEKGLCYFLLMLIVTFIFSGITFNLIEKPFVALGKMTLSSFNKESKQSL